MIFLAYQQKKKKKWEKKLKESILIWFFMDKSEL